MSSTLISHSDADQCLARDQHQGKSLAVKSLTDKFLTVLNGALLDEETVKELYGFGYALYEQERFSEAADVLLYLTLYSKAEGRTFMALAACYQTQAEFQKAAALYRCSIDLGYADPAVYLHLGECLLRLNKKPEAVKAFLTGADLASNLERYSDIFEKASALVELTEKFDCTEK